MHHQQQYQHPQHRELESSPALVLVAPLSLRWHSLARLEQLRRKPHLVQALPVLQHLEPSLKWLELRPLRPLSILVRWRPSCRVRPHPLQLRR